MSLRPFISCLSLILPASACVSRVPVISEEITVAPMATPVSYAHCYGAREAFYTVGGLRIKEDLSATSARGFTFDLKQNAWQPWAEKDELKELGTISTAKIGQDIYVFKSDLSKPTGNELRVFHSDKNTWEKLTVSDRIKARSASTLTAVDENLIIFGGRTADHSSNWAIYNTRSRQWKVYDNYSRELSSHIALSFGTKLLIWGGLDKGKRTKDGYIVDPSNGDVKALAYMPFLNERTNAKAVATEEKLWIIGGMSDRGPKTDGAFYDDSFKSWKQIPPLPYPDRKDFELALIPDRGVLLWGGRDSKSVYVKTAYLLDFDTRLWSEVILPNAPSPRIAHCLGTIGERVYIYGGIGAEPGPEKLWMIHFDDIQPPN